MAKQINSNRAKGKNGKARCLWAGNAPDYIAYHDTEWGFPVENDIRLFEKICLEGFQSGLSWLTILRKRENFRDAFVGFDYERLAKFTQQDVEKLMKNDGIVRHRQKIEATINNAVAARDMAEELGSLATFFWRYEPSDAHFTNRKQRSCTPGSKKLAEDLKKRGWKFIGPTTAYSFMQAMGMVNDHVKNCFVHPLVERARQSFVRPL
tara:strand:+ start:1412 stop:2035 length:624 start_codon:yes stop_codon:yes gene_type:complete